MRHHFLPGSEIRSWVFEFLVELVRSRGLLSKFCDAYHAPCLQSLFFDVGSVIQHYVRMIPSVSFNGLLQLEVEVAFLRKAFAAFLTEEADAVLATVVTRLYDRAGGDAYDDWKGVWLVKL